MKYYILSLIIMILSTTPLIAQENERKVKIIEIDSTESYYFIKGKFKCKPKGKFVIISRRDTTIVGKERIKLKRTYNLSLSSYFSDKEIKRLPAKKPGTLLLREDGYIIWDGKLKLPYKSSDIESIYYTGNN